MAKKDNKKNLLPVAAGVLGAAATLATVALTQKKNRQKVEKFVKGIKKQSDFIQKKGKEVLEEVVERADTLKKDMEEAAQKIQQGNTSKKKK